MNSEELYTLYRNEMVDLEEPYLWSDEEVYGFVDSAQKKFCKLTGGLGDGTSSITRLSMLPAKEWVPISPLILKVRDAYVVADGREVTVINYEDMPTLGLRFNGATGPAKYLITGIEPAKARFFPVPNETQTIQLIVDRLPLKTIDDEGQALEVAEQHKDGLVFWMKHRGYSKQDAETFDKTKMAEFEAKFIAYCAEAKKEKDRAKHKTRITTYGGIPMGAIPNRNRRY